MNVDFTNLVHTRLKPIAEAGHALSSCFSSLISALDKTKVCYVCLVVFPDTYYREQIQIAVLIFDSDGTVLKNSGINIPIDEFDWYGIAKNLNLNTDDACETVQEVFSQQIASAWRQAVSTEIPSFFCFHDTGEYLELATLKWFGDKEQLEYSRKLYEDRHRSQL